MDEQKNNGCGCAILIALIFLLIGGVLKGCSGANSTEAFVFAQKYVELQLKAPSSADFASITDSDVTEISDNKFRIHSYVDAQNSFGAKVRGTYTIVVEYKDGDWTVDSFNMSQN